MIQVSPNLQFEAKFTEKYSTDSNYLNEKLCANDVAVFCFNEERQITGCQSRNAMTNTNDSSVAQ